MRHRAATLALTAAVLAAPSLARADGPVHPGEWEITTTMSVPGMPMQPPPMVHTQCITHKNPAPVTKDRKGSDCKVLEQKIEGGKVSWKVQCPKGSGEGSITYSGDAFDGAMTFTMQNPRGAGTLQMNQTLHGVRKGDCKQ